MKNKLLVYILLIIILDNRFQRKIHTAPVNNGAFTVAPNQSGNYSSWPDHFKLPQPGVGVIQLTSNFPEDLYIGISSVKGVKSPMYEIILGGWGNTKSVIRRENKGNIEYERPSNIVSGMKLIISLNKTNKTIKVEKVVDGIKSSILEWTDPNFITDVEYFTFTGWNIAGNVADVTSIINNTQAPTPSPTPSPTPAPANDVNNSALMRAVAIYDIEAIKGLKSTGINMATGLYQAWQQIENDENNNVINALKSAGADVNEALYIAAKNNDKSMLIYRGKYKKDTGVNPDRIAYIAAQKNDPAAIEIIKSTFGTNLTNMLYTAAQKNDPTAIKALKKAGADINGALKMATQKNDSKAVTILQASGAIDVVAAVNDAIKKGDVSALKELAQSGADIIEELYNAAQRNDSKAIETLKNAGANLNDALYRSAQKKSSNAITTLKKSGADINITSYNAWKNNDTSVIATLNASGADAHAGLYWAYQKNDLDTVKKIIKGSSATIEGAIKVAIQKNDLTVINKLKDGIDINQLLYEEAKNNNTEGIKTLKQIGADVDTALYKAYRSMAFNDSSSALAFEVLKKAGADINAALYLAYKIKESGVMNKIITALIDNGADRNEALTIASKKNDTSVINALKAAIGVSTVNEVNTLGTLVKSAQPSEPSQETKLNIAIKNNDLAAIKALKSAGADIEEALCLAAQTNKTTDIRTLKAAGADINIALYTTLQNNPAINEMENLILAGANIDTVINLALEKNNSNVIKFLIQRYYDFKNGVQTLYFLRNVEAAINKAFYAAAQKNNKSDITTLKSAGAEINAALCYAYNQKSSGKDAMAVINNLKLNGADEKFATYYAAKTGDQLALNALNQTGVNLDGVLELALSNNDVKAIQQLNALDQNRKGMRRIDLALKRETNNKSINRINMLKQAGAVLY